MSSSQNQGIKRLFAIVGGVVGASIVGKLLVTNADNPIWIGVSVGLAVFIMWLIIYYFVLD